ncbi:hypothetical protein [Sorangium sp. So ce542]|uniref:hypothetical protein n=1 Tax=Sorangium sp. So ce542 TaxID=3133316 RepID=UPI003F61902A
MGLFFVAGEVGGEAVSRAAIEMVHAAFEDDSVGNACAGAMDAPQCRDEIRLMMSPHRTNHRYLEDDGPEQRRSGVPASFAGVLLAPGAAYMASIGDMRVYRFRCGKLEERTRDVSAHDGGMSDQTISPAALVMLTQHANAATRALGCEVALETKTQSSAPNRATSSSCAQADCGARCPSIASPASLERTMSCASRRAC